MKLSSSSKIIFDLIMFVLLITVYLARPTGVLVHEYIGLVVYIFFITHLVFNYKWIINVGKKILKKGFSIRVKILYSIAFLLFVTFILIGISGIMISRHIFTIQRMPVWRQLHTILAAFSLILLSAHIGLHINMIKNIIKNKVKFPYRAVKAISAGFIIIILSFGIYGEIRNRTYLAPNRMPQYSTVTALFERSIIFTRLLINPPQEAAPTRQASPSGGQRQTFSFDLSRLLISASNYISYILLGSILVYWIDSKR